MKNILILGATGAMGIYLVPELASMGYYVDAAALDEPRKQVKNVKYYKFNAKDDNILKDFLSKKKYDAIIDFMLYNTDEFQKRYEMLLSNTKHYIFLSSYRVYSNAETPIKETSPRLLEAADKEFLAREKEEYALYKARQEDILKNSSFSNWTILRPTMVYSTYRYQLVGLEANVFLYRAQNNKTIVLPENAMGIHAAMTWSGDVAKMISRLILNEKACREVFTVGSSEMNTWGEVAQYYKDIAGISFITVSIEEYKKIFKDYIGEWYKHLYDRFFDRVIDNSKILKVTDLKQLDFMPLKEGLKKELLSIKGKYEWPASDISRCMDEYLKEIN